MSAVHGSDANLAPFGAMTPSAESPVPMYHQISLTIRQRIVEGAYSPGSRLAREDMLASEFKVSRATIRQAIGLLVRDGLLVRKQGLGTFVVEVPKPLGQRFRGSLGSLLEETRTTKTSFVSVETNEAIPPRIAELLRLGPPVGTVVKRTRTIDQRLFAYTVNYLPSAIGDLLTGSDLTKESMMDLLQQKGLVFAGAEQSVRAQVADLNLSERLEVEFGSPVLFVERFLYGLRRSPIEFVQTWYRGDLYEYLVTFDLRRHRRAHQNLA